MDRSICSDPPVDISGPWFRSQYCTCSSAIGAPTNQSTDNNETILLQLVTKLIERLVRVQRSVEELHTTHKTVIKTVSNNYLGP